MSKSSEHNNLLVKTSIVAEQQPPSQPSNYRGERVRKKSVIDKILYTETLPLEYDHKIMEISENNLAEDSESIGEKRERWNSFMEYFLSIIGFVIDLGNVWRYSFETFLSVCRSSPTLFILRDTRVKINHLEYSEVKISQFQII